MNDGLLDNCTMDGLIFRDFTIDGWKYPLDQPVQANKASHLSTGQSNFSQLTLRPASYASSLRIKKNKICLGRSLVALTSSIFT